MALSNRFDEALVYASSVHREQTRKGTPVPYVSHLLSVAALVIEHGGDEDQAIAALLHDTVEDQGIDKADEIKRKFGDTVFSIVMGCTDAEVQKGEAKPPWRERKEAYIARVKGEPASTKLVSAADKLHNARSTLADYRLLGEEVWQRFKGGRDGTLWYYREVVIALGDGEQTEGLGRLTGELGRVVAELDRIAGVTWASRSGASISKSGSSI